MRVYNIQGAADSTQLWGRVKEFAAAYRRKDGPIAFFSNGQVAVMKAIQVELEKRGKANDQALADSIFRTDQKELYLMLKGSEAEACINPETAGSAGILNGLRTEVAGMV